MSAAAQERTSRKVRPMSAPPPRADIVECNGYVRFLREADITLAHSITSSARASKAEAEPVIRSVELIVHPEAKNGVGEMAVRSDLPPLQKISKAWSVNHRGTRSDASGVEVA